MLFQGNHKPPVSTENLMPFLMASLMTWSHLHAPSFPPFIYSLASWYFSLIHIIIIMLSWRSISTSLTAHLNPNIQLPLFYKKVVFFSLLLSDFASLYLSLLLVSKQNKLEVHRGMFWNPVCRHPRKPGRANIQTSSQSFTFLKHHHFQENPSYL